MYAFLKEFFGLYWHLNYEVTPVMCWQWRGNMHTSVINHSKYILTFYNNTMLLKIYHLFMLRNCKSTILCSFSSTDPVRKDPLLMTNDMRAVIMTVWRKKFSLLRNREIWGNSSKDFCFSYFNEYSTSVPEVTSCGM